MNTGKKIFCRMNHKFINSLMPILPYRQPEILENIGRPRKQSFPTSKA